MTLPLMLPLFDIAGFEATCVAWAKAAANVSAVWEGEDGAQPDRPYVEFSLLTSQDLTGATRLDETNEQTGKIERGYYKLQTVRIQVTALTDSDKPAKSAHQICERLLTALGSDDYKENLFLPAGIGINGNTLTRRVPMLEDGVRWRSKAVFEVDMTIACNQAGVETLIPIESVKTTGTLVGGVDGDITDTETITT